MHVLIPVLIAVGVLVIGVWTMRSVAEVTPPAELCMDDEIQEQIRTIMLAAIDQGLKEHTVHVFQNWLKDPSDQPKRAVAGLRVGVSAYLRSRAAMDKWDPPRCPEK